MLASLEHVLIALIEVEGCDEHWRSTVGLRQSKMKFHQALDLILELDEVVVGRTRDILSQRDCLDRFRKIPWVVPTFAVIEGEASNNAYDSLAFLSRSLPLADWSIIRLVMGLTWISLWSFMVLTIEIIEQGNGSKILLCGDGSCWKTFKPVASLIEKGKLKNAGVGLDPQTEVYGMSIRLHQPDGVESKRYHIASYGELNGIPVSLVARFGVIFKGTDRIHVSYGG
nr:hypothetical protein [Tanacetum cinerariifolium]